MRASQIAWRGDCILRPPPATPHADDTNGHTDSAIRTVRPTVEPKRLLPRVKRFDKAIRKDEMPLNSLNADPVATRGHGQGKGK